MGKSWLERMNEEYLQQEEGAGVESNSWIPAVQDEKHRLLKFRLRRWAEKREALEDQSGVAGDAREMPRGQSKRKQRRRPR
jgi:hypothetical protein